MRRTIIAVTTTALLMTVLAISAIGTPAQAQGTHCADFLHNRDGSWTSFADDEMLLPRGPVPIHEGERFSRGSDGAKAFIARILDAQCRPGSRLY